MIDFVYILTNQPHKMSLRDRYALKMLFFNEPPPSVYADAVLPDPIMVLYAPFANHHTALSQEFTPWAPGPGELHFECEFITDGAAGGSSNRHVFKPAYYDELPAFLEQTVPIRLVGFEQLKISPNPGNYIFQVTGYLLREGMDPVALKSISSGPIEVLSKVSDYRRATYLSSGRG